MSAHLPPGTATGVGSLPGTDVDEACRVVAGELPDLPHLPELPGRGAGADLIGRTAARLEGLAVDLQPAGWRLVDRPGVDQRRAAALLARDLDAFEVAMLGCAGAVKVQLCGPWTLAASLDRGRAGKVLADPGARRDLGQSLAETVASLRQEVSRRIPAATVLVQLDEPLLPAVLAGTVATASGFGRHRAVDESEVVAALRDVLAAAGPSPAVHCCASDVPVALLVRAGAAALSVDVARIRASALPDLGAAVDDGASLWLGVVPATDPPGRPPDAERLARRVGRFWSDLGFGVGTAAERTVVTPACGLAGASPAWARSALHLAVRTGRLLPTA